MEEVNGAFILTVVLGGSLTCFGFLLRYWFGKINVSQDRIIEDLGDNRVTLAKQEIATEALKQYNEDSQKRIFREIHTLSKSMNNSLKIISDKTDKNTLDIANLQSANVFISREIKEIKRNEKGK